MRNKKRNTIIMLSTALLIIFIISILKMVHPIKNILRISPSTQEPLKKIPKADRIDLAWQQEFERTKDPALGYVPRERLQRARIQAIQKRSNLKLLGKASSIEGVQGISGIEWTERGPSNVGGRTRALMFDPNDVNGTKVWAGGVTGGLWYNDDITNDDSPWQNVDDFWDNIAITCITVDPNDNDIFYIGTGEGFTSGSGSSSRGEGVWKSTDGGSTWSQLAASTGYYWVNDIVVRDESGTSVLYVGTAQRYYKGEWFGSPDQGLYRSDNGGASFIQVLPNAPGSTHPYSIADIEIGADNRIYVGSLTSSYGYGGGTILYSDAGTSGSWTANTTYASVTDVNRVELACAPSNSNIVYALVEANTEVERVGYSDDKGVTWSDMSEPDDADTGILATDFSRNQGWYDLILAVDPNNASKVYAGAIDLFRGEYSGDDITWTQISKWSNNSDMNTLDISEVHADQHAIVFKEGSSTEAVFGCDGGVYYSPNCDNEPPDILERNKNYNTIQYYACAIHPDPTSSYFLAGCQDNGTHRLTEIGLSPGIEVTGGDGAFCHIDQDEPQYQFTAYVYNSLYRSVDEGQTFTRIWSLSTGYFINPSDYDDTNNIFYANYDGGRYFRWDDPQTGTTAWAVGVPQFDGGRQSAVTVSPNITNRVYFGTEFGLVVRVDDAHDSPTGTQINSSAGMPAGSVSSIAIEDGDDDHLLVTYYNYGVASVWETTNGGSTWTSVEGNLPDMPVRSVLFNPNNSDQALIATEVGVWTTDNLNGSSTEWDPSVSGLANVRVDMLKTRSSDNLVIAATHGRGLFTTDAFSTAQAQFSADRTSWLINRPIQFEDGSLQAVSWSWNFGDGNTSTEQNPSHVYTTAGNYTVSLTINSDADTETKTDYITIFDNPSIPYSEDFDSNNGGFFHYSVSEGEDYWAWGVGTKPNFSGTNQSISGNNWMTSLAENHGYSTKYALESPPFNFEGGTGSYILAFDYRLLSGGSTSTAPNASGFNIQYSINGGTTWEVLGDYGDPNGTNWYTNDHLGGLDGEPGFWRQSLVIYSPTYDITSLSGESDVRFRFIFGAKNSAWEGAQIDNFEIQGNSISTIAGPDVVNVSGVSNNSVDLNWSGNSSEFRVVQTEGGPASSPTTGEFVYEGSEVSTTASGLTENTTYFFTAFGKASGSQAYSSATEFVATVPSTSNTVSMSIPASQTGDFVFGNTGVIVDITSNEDADGGTMQSIRFNSTPTGNNSISGTASAPDASVIIPNVITPARYWTITNDLSGSNSYTVYLDISGLGGIVDPDKLLIMKRETSGGWIAQNTLRNNNFLYASVNSFSDFTIGADAEDNSLPVSLSSFVAQVQKGNINLIWTTESEYENEMFILSKSINGQSFSKLTEVPGQGTSNTHNEYSYTDTDIKGNNNYAYALSARDINGSLTFHDTVSVTSEMLIPQQFALYAPYPNPFNPQTNIRFDLPMSVKNGYKVKLNVYNALGQLIKEIYQGSLEAGTHTYKWNGTNNNNTRISSGLYFISIEADQFRKMQKVILIQ